MPVRRRPVMRPAITNQSAGLDGDIQVAFDAILRGVKIPASVNLSKDVTVKRAKYFHRQSLGTTSVAAGSLNFFAGTAASKFRCNFPNNGQLPQNYAFALKRVSIFITPGLSIAGAADVDGELFGGMTAAEAAAMDVQTTQVGALGTAEDMRKILHGGHLALKIGDKTVAECHDLTNFPANRGLFGNAHSSTTDTGVTLHSAYYTNGQPGAIGGWTFDPAYPVVPGRAVSLDLSWETALTVVDVGWICAAELEGILVTPANL
jgi:hypothetical protein